MLNDSASSDVGVADAFAPSSVIVKSPRQALAGSSSHSIKAPKKSRRTLRSSLYPFNDETHGAKSRSFGEINSNEHPPESETSDRTLLNGGKISAQRIGRRQRTLKASGPSCQSNISTDIGSEAGAQGASVTSSPRTSSPPSAARNTSADVLSGNDPKSRTTVQAGAEHAKKKQSRKATSSSNLSQKLKLMEESNCDAGAGLGQKIRNSVVDQISKESSAEQLGNPSAQCNDLAKVEPNGLLAEPRRTVIATTASGEYTASTMSSSRFEVEVVSSSAEPHRSTVVAASTASTASVGESKIAEELSKNTQNPVVGTPGGCRSPVATIAKLKRSKTKNRFTSPLHKSRKSKCAQAKPLFCSSNSTASSSRPANIPMLPLSSIPREASSDSEENASKTKTYGEADSASSSESSSEDGDDDPAFRNVCSEPGKSTQGIAPEAYDMSPVLTGAQSLPTTGFCSSNSGPVVGEVASRSLFDTPKAEDGSKRFNLDNDEEDGERSSDDDEDEECEDEEEEEAEEESDDEEGDKENVEPDSVFPTDYRVEYKPFAFSRWSPAIVRHYDKGYYVLDVHPHVHHSRVRKIQDPLVSLAHTSKDPRREMAKSRELPKTTTAGTATSRRTRKSTASRFKSVITAPYYVIRRYWCFTKSKKPQNPSTNSEESNDEGSTGKAGWFKRNKAKAEPRQGLLEMTT